MGSEEHLLPKLELGVTPNYELTIEQAIEQVQAIIQNLQVAILLISSQYPNASDQTSTAQLHSPKTNLPIIQKQYLSIIREDAFRLLNIINSLKGENVDPNSIVFNAASKLNTIFMQAMVEFPHSGNNLNRDLETAKILFQNECEFLKLQVVNLTSWIEEAEKTLPRAE